MVFGSIERRIMDKIIISGNLGNDPELRYFEDGRGVCNFSMCSNRKMRDGTSEMIKKAIGNGE